MNIEEFIKCFLKMLTKSKLHKDCQGQDIASEGGGAFCGLFGSHTLPSPTG